MKLPGTVEAVTVPSVAATAPQATFHDLYTAVYALIDDAKRDHALSKLYKGSHGADDPHPHVQEFGAYFFRQQRGLFAFTSQSVTTDEPATVAALDAYDAEYRPRVSVRTAFDLLANAETAGAEEQNQDLLTYLVSRRHKLARYRGGSSGYDDEARAFAAAHFRVTGIPATPEEVLISCGGAKGVFLQFCAALMCRHESERVHRMSGRLLAPAGYYQSLRVVPPIFGGSLDVTESLTGTAVREWLTETTTVGGRAVYVPLVNNFGGHVLDRERAHGIAAAVLDHNRRNPTNPAYVLGDDVYADSYLNPTLIPAPIGSVSGVMLGDRGLGTMADWTVSVVTSSKTFALPTSRVAFAVTGNPRLRAAMEHYRTMLSHGRVPQGDELSGAAALCLTPREWITEWNTEYLRRVRWLIDQLAAINRELGMDAFRMFAPEGGWYAAVHISPVLFGDSRVRTSVHALAVCLYYGCGRRDTGIGLLPGELAGHQIRGEESGSAFVLRASLAVTGEELTGFVARLRELGNALCGHEAPQVISQALQRARTVADIEAILP